MGITYPRISCGSNEAWVKLDRAGEKKGGAHQCRHVSVTGTRHCPFNWGGRGGGGTDYISHIFSLVPKSMKSRWLKIGTLEAESKWYVRSFRSLFLDLAARWQAVVPDVRRLVNGEAAVRWTAPRGRVRGWGRGGGRHLRTWNKDTLRHRKKHH